MHNGCVLKGGVGTGKSITALAYFLFKESDGSIPLNGVGEVRAPKRPRDVFVITTAKKRDGRDWQLEAAPFLISEDREASLGGIKLTVDSWNNIVNYTDVEDAFFIFDEQRLVGSGAWVKAFLKLAKTNRWIMLSATPGDDWMDYCPVFIANGWYKNRTAFIHEHVVYSNFSKFPKIERYVELKKLYQYRQQVLVEMPYLRHTKRHEVTRTVQYPVELFSRVYVDRWHIYEERPLRDVSEMFIVMRKLVNADPSRLGAVMETMEKAPRLIVFYNHNHELDALRTLGSTLGVESREWNGKKHEEVPTGDKWIYLVQYTAGAEGWNCVTTDSILFYSLPYSWKIWEQAHGRIDRINTKYVDLWYYILRSGAFIDQQIWKALQRKKNFNERKAVTW